MADVPSEVIEAFMLAEVLVILPTSLVLIVAGVGSGDVLLLLLVESVFLQDKTRHPAIVKKNT